MAKESDRQKDNSKGRQKSERPKRDVESSDLMEKVLYINRCSKTVKGGRKMSFSALILVGDGKGRVGYGFAKANELTEAIRKGGEVARKSLHTIELEETTIPHEVYMKWDGANVFIRPASAGTGVIAGSKVRAILEFAGVKDVMAKSYGASNPINLVRATFKALLSLTNRQKVLQAREAV